MTVPSSHSSHSSSARVQDAFAQAVELSGIERAAFLTRLRSDDAVVAKEVESLLGYHDESDSILDRHPTISLPPSLVGEIVGGCTLERVIGAGGMSAVYAAVQGFPPRRVAVKIVRRERLSASARRRLRVEAEALGRLEHPNIARVYAAGSQQIGSRETDGESPFIVMELVEGAVTLPRWADDHELDAVARITLLATICDAVEHAHRAGVIHRDIKPGNVIVGLDGTPKVIDFGIASVADSTVTAATEGPMGTLAYMSPEQARGSTIDTRSDVWGLGALLYDLLADRPPFDMRDSSLERHLDRLLHDQPTQIAQAASESRTAAFVERLPAATDAVLRKALSTDPDRRYRSAGEFGDELRRLVRGEALLARPDSDWDGLTRLMRRHRTPLIAASGIALALVAALILSLALLNSEQRAVARANWSAYVASISAANAMLDQGDASAAHEMLATAPPSLRGWEWNYLAPRCDQTEWQTQLPIKDQVYGLDYADDGRTLFAAASRHRVALDTTTHAERWRASTASTDPYWRVRALNDGGAIFVRLIAGLERVDASGAIEATVADSDVLDIGLDAARTRLFTNSPDGFVERDIHSLELLRSIAARPPLTALPRAIAVAPDASRIIMGDMGGSVTALDSTTGVVAWSWKTPGAAVEIRGVAFSKDGTRVVACGGIHLVVFDAVTGDVVWHLVQTERFFRAPNFSADGNEVLVATWMETVDRYDARDGAFVASITGCASQVWNEVPSPDGTSIAAGCLGARVQVFASDASTEIPTIALDGSAVVSVAASTRVYAVTALGALYTIDRETLESKRFPIEVHANAVRIAPDGTLAIAHNSGVLWLSADGAVLRRASTTARAHHIGFVDRGAFTAVACDDGNEVFFNTTSGAEKFVVADRAPNCGVACDTQREGVLYIPAGQGGAPRLVNLTTRSSENLLLQPEYPNVAALSPDRTTLAIGAIFNEGEVTLVDARTMKQRANMPNHRGIVRAIAWNTDGSRIASTASDDTVRIWHVEHESEILTAWRGACADIAFDASDALWLACADGQLRVLRAR